MVNPRQPHSDTAYRLFRYIKQSLSQGILLSSSNTLQIHAFCDSDWATCPETYCSITRIQRLEEIVNKLSEALLPTKEASSNNNNGREGSFHSHREENDGGRQVFSSKMARLEFPKYFGEDPMEWLSRVAQFFEFQDTTDNQKFFEEELWASFGPTECENFDETLSRVQQVGSLREYQKEFERLGNRVQGWTQKALVGTFMGGLKSEIVDGIRMFKPKILKESISLARMKDE
ncbi:hypothetical protein CK203_075110 [Vitis vinifera]|uniref:Retrotransposon gag domain-containing protein n=1 Tax=Vitis vinifera TaxID=29760 RepID=A0A438F9N4_VITVI|nr:hypothetical protein CK203_075110 [Vitis vinifera]